MPESFHPPRIYKTESQEEKAHFSKNIERNFYDQEFNGYPEEIQKLIAETELEKPDFMIPFVESVNSKLGVIFEQLGLDIRTVPLGHIHLIPKATMEEVERSEGIPRFANGVARSDSVNQSILACRPSFEKYEIKIDNAYAKLYFLRMVTHEMVHAAAYQSFSVLNRWPDGQRMLYPHRSGLHMQNGRRSVFHYLNEGLTDQITNKIFREIVTEQEFLSTFERGQYGQEISELMEHYDNPSRPLNGPYFMDIEALNYIYEEMSKANPTKYPSPENAKNHFMSAYFGGKIIDLAREIKSVFGQGGLRTTQTSLPYKITPDLRRRRMVLKIVEPFIKLFKKTNI